MAELPVTGFNDALVIALGCVCNHWGCCLTRISQDNCHVQCPGVARGRMVYWVS